MRVLKKGMSLLLALLILCALPLQAFAEELGPFKTEEEVIDALQAALDGGGDEMEFTCDAALYASLSDDDFVGLLRLLYQAGLDGSCARIRYQDSQRLIRVQYLRELGGELYPCETINDVDNAIRIIAENKAEEYYLLCAPALYETLKKNSDTLSYAAAKYGVRGQMIYSYDDIGLFEISSPSFMEPYAYVEDYAQFAAAVDHFAESDVTDFYIAFSKDVYERISEDEGEMRVMIAGSKLDRYGYIGHGSGVLNFYGCRYSDITRAICWNTEDLADIIARMGASGVSAFEIVFPNTETFEALYENDFALLHQLEAEGGLTSGKLSYSMGHDRLIYEEAVIASQVTPLTSAADAMAYMDQAVAAGDTEVYLFCTEALYADLLGDLQEAFTVVRSGMNRIYDLLSQAGVSDYELSASGSTHVITVKIKQLFPGTAITMAEKSGDLSTLSDRELQTREAALKIAAEAAGEDPLATAKAIHDWLCDHVVYTDDEETDEDDTAIGAILNGEANCDGYTDAFYLIGTLAGLHVRYQHGDSYEKGGLFPSFTPITHIWNLLELDGAWRMVDVTWDDMEEGPVYIWFNVGQDVASLMHYWNEDMTVSLAAGTDRVYRAENEFYIADAAELQAAMQQVGEKKPAGFYLIAPGMDSEQLREEVGNALSVDSYRYSWDERMSMLTVSDLRWR